MYCKHCGNQISDNSKYCQFCGGKQDDSVAPNMGSDESYTKLDQKTIEIPKIKSNLSTASKWRVIVCCAWIIINLYWLFAGRKFSTASSYFVPFSGRSFLGCYDFSEFLVYVFGLPIIIWAIVLYKSKKNNNSTPKE